MKIAVCIPLYGRTEYLDAVFAGLRLQQACDSEMIIYLDGSKVPKVRSMTWGPSIKSISDEPDLGPNQSIIRLFDAAVIDGADVLIYLADDCVPSPDFLRISETMATAARQRGSIAFGLWYPTDKRAVKYPELILERRGELWPAKCFGTTRENWPLLKPIVNTDTVTFDMALSSFLSKRNRHILVPLCSRVMDIGRNGHYNSPTTWDRDFSWIVSLQEEFHGEYSIFQ